MVGTIVSGEPLYCPGPDLVILRQREIAGLIIVTAILCPCLYTVRGQGIIEIMAMGQVGPGDCPLHSWFSAVPDIDVVLVITKQDVTVLSMEEMRRWIRIYLPRNRKEMIEKFDHLIFVDSWLTGWESGPLLTPAQMRDMKRAIGEDGLPVFSTGLWSSETSMIEGVLASDIEEFYPVNLRGKRSMERDHLYKVEVNRKEGLPEVLKVFLPLGIENFQGMWAGQLYPKQGATIWATMKDCNIPNPPPGGWPWLVSWEVGSADTLFWVAADDLEVKWWWGFYDPPTENPYGVDVLCNIIYHSLDMDLPDDILLVHETRRKFIEFNDRKALCVSVIEFAERFNANSGRLWSDLADIEGQIAEARGAYLEHRFVEARGMISDAEEAMAELDDRAVALKNNSLMWVFIIEWFAVAAVSLVSGTVLWWLMVRRRVYREVRVTRSTSL